MKIIVSQQNKKISVEFHYPHSISPLSRGRKRGGLENGLIIDKYKIDKADDFLGAIDKFLKRRNNSLASVFNANLDLINTGMLTERIIRAIIDGLRF